MSQDSRSPRCVGGLVVVRMPRLELGTSRLSGVRSNQLSYTRAPWIASPSGQAAVNVAGGRQGVNAGWEPQRGQGVALPGGVRLAWISSAYRSVMPAM